MNIKIIIIPALTAFVLNMIFTPVIIKVALKFKWYDHVNDRKIHTGNIPRLGGVGIFVSFIISFLLFFILLKDHSSVGVNIFKTDLINWKLYSFIFSITSIFVIGLIDDFSNLKARYKLIIQLAVALALVLSGFLFERIAIPFTSIVLELKYFSYPLTFVWFLGVINAVNLIDGMDGLSAGTSFISLLFLGIIGYITGNLFIAYISFILMSSLLAFLVFNLPPAKLFMGDSGSLFLGTALSIFPFFGKFSQEYLWVSDSLIFIVILLYIIPIFDTLSAIVRRTFIKRVHFFNPDKEHLHHKLLNFKLSTKKALAVIYSLTIIGGITALLYILLPKTYNDIALVVGFSTLLILFLVITIFHNIKKDKSLN